MKFIKLTMQNFRVFYGKQSIDFRNKNNDSSNIFLIGGLNGSGKTTILTAVQLILYGKGTQSNNEFKESMNGTLNSKYLEEKGKSANLSLIIESNGKFYTISVILYYDSKNNFSLMERTMSITNKHIKLTEQEIQTFINKNIPLDASAFFLFDGEKIQNLIEKQEDRSLKKSIQKIIALEFYKETLDDISKANIIVEKEYNKQVNSKDIKKVIDIKDELEDRLEKLKEKLAVQNKKYKDADFQLQKLKQVKQDKIEKYYNTKESLYKKESRLDEQLTQINRLIEVYAKDSLPLLIISPIIKELQVKIKEESNYKLSRDRFKQTFKQFDKFMAEFLDTNKVIDLDEKQTVLLYEHGKEIWSKHNNITYQEPKQVEIIHDLNDNDSKILQSIKVDNIDFDRLIMQKKNIEADVLEIKEKIKDAPEAEDYRDEEIKIERVTKTLGEYNLRIRSLQSKIQREKSELDRINYKYNELRKQYNENSDLDKQLNLLNKLSKVAKDFVEDVTLFKAKCIKEDFEYIIHQLLRKTSDFSKIEFDTNSYSIKIYNHNNTLIQLQNRSAGEKQIIALSLIWALTKNATIDLPYVIDTPLGRLDSIHRNNLIEHYFPYLSNQVIILSTDTEVNYEFNKKIINNVTESYRLDYDEDKRYSVIKNGYFKFE